MTVDATGTTTATEPYRDSRVGRIAAMVRRDASLGPRSPIVIMAVVLPLLMTFVVAAVFGNLLDTTPRLVVYAAGQSDLVAVLQAEEGLDVTVADDPAGVTAILENHDQDAALVLPPGIDEALRAGDAVSVEYLVSGSSLAQDRAALQAMVTSALREVAGQETPVQVEISIVGGEDHIPLGDRMIPLLVVYALVVAATFVPAASILDERTTGTLNAVLATPAGMGEVLVAKAIFAGVLSLAMGVLTLVINQAFGVAVLGIVVSLLVGTVMLVQFGLILGLWAKDLNTLYTWIKAGGILIVLPGLIALFPSLPSWIPMITPTYYFLDPIYELSLGTSRFTDVLPQLGVGVLVCAALTPLVRWSARSVEERSLSG